MSNGSWTAEQNDAIMARKANVLVSAAAGAGKTSVLVERLIRRITDPQEPVGVDRILVVTFTNAAAQEMKERIGTALIARQKAEPDNLYLAKQLLLLPKAAISTLHSFCLDLIRQNYYRLELPEGLTLDPGFRVADEVETSLLRLDVLDELFEEQYAAENPMFIQLVESFGGNKDDGNLQNLILKLYSFSRSQRDPEQWLSTAAAVFFADSNDVRLADYFKFLADTVLDQVTDALRNLQEAAKMAAQPEGPQVYLTTIQEEIGFLQELLCLEGKDWPHLYQALQDYKFARLKACRNEVDPVLRELAKDLRSAGKEGIEELKKNYLARSPAEMVRDMQDLAPRMAYLCSLVGDFGRRYLTAKLTKNIIDFNDIEHLALGLLTTARGECRQPSPLAEKLRQHYVEALIDEYQDINGVQEAILFMVTRHDWEQPNMFMVGDVKQSIYGFRLTDPSLFLGKYQRFSEEETARERKIRLSANFRSRPNILQAVNYIFRQVMTARMGGLVYDQAAELACGASYPILTVDEGQGLADLPVEVYILDQQSANPDSAAGPGDKGEESGEEEEDLAALQREARIMGRRIQELLGTMIWDKGAGKYRPASYRDMVVLLRSAKGSADLVLEEFRSLGIPSYADIGGGYFAALEVQIMVALLKIIDNPRQDIELAAVLRSPLAGFKAAQLAELRIARPRGDYYDALRLAARRAEGQTGQKARFFLNRLQEWRTFARRHSLTELIWQLYQDTGYYTYVGALPGGKQRQANLRALQDRAREFEQTSLQGLFKYIRFLEKLADRNNDLGVARALGEKEDVVRIMSIHKSKGLEFPVVFLAGLGKGFNRQDLRDDILVDKDLGLGPVWADPVQRLKYPTLAHLAVKDKLTRDNLAEEVRILYVAMTRAKETLILVGSVRGLERKLAKWRMALQEEKLELPPNLLGRAGSFLDWLGPALLRHSHCRVLRQRIPQPVIREEELEGRPWYQDDSRWLIWLEDPERTAKPEQSGEFWQQELEKISRLEALEVSQDSEEAIAARLSWQYPRKELISIPAKVTVSELKNRYRYQTPEAAQQVDLVRFRELGRRPRFLLAEQGLAATEKGSALHLVMQHLDLQRVGSEADLAEQLEELVRQEIITELQKQVIEMPKIQCFLQHPLGQRLLSSIRVRREIPFTLALGPGDLQPHLENSKDTIILQGTLDCLFQEEDGYVLIDYKTDRIRPETAPAFVERYRVQMELYARAVETILKVPVKEKLLYSFYLGEAFTL